MTWYDKDSWLTMAFAPNWITIVITILTVLLLPTAVHYFLYRPTTPSSLPSFVVVGPNRAGKTAIVTAVRKQKNLTSTPTPVLEKTLKANPSLQLW
jgi:hypothetical protein